MEHPWFDAERNLVCATILLFWAGILIELSGVSFVLKAICLASLCGLLVYHARQHALTYETTIAGIIASGVLSWTEPLYLPQTVLLVVAFLVLMTLFTFLPAQTMLTLMVFGLSLLYSVLVAFAIAVRTDPSFTGLFLLVLSTFWLVFVRPAQRNAI